MASMVSLMSSSPASLIWLIDTESSMAPGQIYLLSRWVGNPIKHGVWLSPKTGTCPENMLIRWLILGFWTPATFKVVKNMPKPVPSGHPLAFQDEKRSTGKNELLFHDRLNLPPGHGKRWIVQTTQGVTSRSISRSLYSFGQTFEFILAFKKRNRTGK